MKSYENFTFNGIKSVDIGVYNVFVGETPKEILAGSRSLITSKPYIRNRNVLHKIDVEPLTFTLQISPLDGDFTSELIHRIYDWFDVDDYCKLSFADSRHFYYKCIPFVGSQAEIELYVRKEGYFPVSFECDAPYGYVDFVKETHLWYTNTETFHIENKGGIKINGSYKVPMFLSCELDTGCKLQVNTSASDKIFTLTNPSSENVNKVEVDADTGIVTCDDSYVNPYTLCDNVDYLMIDGNKENTLTVTKTAGMSCKLNIGASISCMIGKETVDIDHIMDNYVSDGLKLFYDGLTGLKDNTNRFCEIVSGREIEVTRGIESINADGQVEFDGNTYIESNTLVTNSNLTIEVFCNYEEVTDAEQCIVNTFEQVGFGILNNEYHKNSLAAWINNEYKEISIPSPAVAGQLYHIAGVIEYKNNYTSMRIYENGNVFSLENINGKISHNEFGIEIGKNCLTPDKKYYFKGGIRTVRIYDRALTASEVLKNYREDVKRYERNVVNSVG